jgi:hypothetical protein
MAQQKCSQQALGAPEATQHEALHDDAVGVEFTAEEQERLARLRRAVESGERGETYPLDKRQDFVRWLIAQGKFSEN